MQMFWDISPTSAIQNSKQSPSESVNATARRLLHATYLLTQAIDEDSFPSASTRESVLRWASEEKNTGRYIGRCRVIDLRAVTQVIRPQHLAPNLFGKVHRVVIKTRSELHEGQPILTADSIKLLASCGVKLIGIDTSSLDAPNSATREAYKTALQLGISIMLNLSLDEIAAGDYELIALPADADGIKAGTFRDLEIQYAKSLTTRAA